MFINFIPFTITISWLIQMGKVKNIPSAKYTYTLKAINAVAQLYTKRGFKTTVLVEGNFEPLRGELSSMGIEMDIVSARKYALKVEIYIRQRTNKSYF